MNPQHRKSPIIHLLLLSCLLIVCIIGAASSTAQSPAGEEREFKNTIPAHVPIRVKIKNEQSFKKMDNARWARELEIEVKNTSSKPIYYLYMIVVMPEMVNNEGHALTFQVHYGRKDLVRWDTPIQPEDVPIRPGESTTLKISETQWKAFEAIRHKEKVSNPKRVEFDMQLITFGDGTGFRGRDGRPVTDPAKRQSSNVSRPTKMVDTCPPTARAGAQVQLNSLTRFTHPRTFRGLIFIRQILPQRRIRARLS